VARRSPWLAIAAFLATLACASHACAASLDDLRATALAAVNADRAAAGLPPLEAEPALAAAAQRHADDMRARDYAGHVSPEGRDAADRYREAGGESWRKVGENIAQCGGCGAPGEATLRAFQRGWMESPGHRGNILDPGFRRFGFGLAANGGQQVAVQTFAGPGGDGAAAGAAPADLPALAAALVNARRAEAGAPALEPDKALSEAARDYLSRRLPDGSLDGAAEAMLGAGSRWRRLVVLIGECGGCGAGPGGGDAERFVRMWSGDGAQRQRLLAPAFGHLGFALWADGGGRKVALAVLARP